MTTFGSEFRKLRMEARCRLRDVASAWGVRSLSYVSDIENDRRSPPALPMVRDALSLFGRLDQFERLGGLAARASRGRLRVGKTSTELQELFVTLNRQDLTGEDLREAIQFIESLRRNRKNHGPSSDENATKKRPGDSASR